MIVVSLKGGLGNQMFQYAVGRSLSLQLGTSLRLDTEWFELVANNKYATVRHYELDVFRIKGLELEERRRFWMEKLRERRFRHVRRLLHHFHSSLAPDDFYDREAGFDERVFRSGRNLVLDGYWQNEAYFKNIRDVLLKDFTFKEEPDRENAEMLSCILSSTAVCVHIRRGDYLRSTESAVHGSCDLSYYDRAISLIRERADQPTFYIFSDDPEWVLSSFPMPKESVVVRHNTGRKNAEDLRLMMNCRHFITANSSFSWWAAWLGEREGSIVYRPEPWFVAPQYSGNEFCPSRWIKVQRSAEW
jgi:hypothetical protein